MIELVVFDCDGVLVDSERVAVRVNVAVLGELGWELTGAEVVERFIGRSNAAISAQIAERLGPDAAAEWERRFRRHHLETDIPAVAGVVDALDRITIPACVASSGGHDKMRHTLGRTGLYDRFAGRIFSASEVERGKPAPDLFLHAARQVGVDPGQCVVVEDSRSGVQAARAAGMRVLAYAGGVTPAERLAGPGTVVFTEMAELPGLLAAL